MERKRAYLWILSLSLCLAVLFLAAGCKPEEPAVPEAIITEPAVSEAPEPQSLDLTLALPEDAEEGDLLIAQISYSGAETTVTPPSSDWVVILESGNDDGLRTVSYYMILRDKAGSGGAYVFALTGGASDTEGLSAAGKIAWFRGVDPDNPIQETAVFSGDGSVLNGGIMDGKNPCFVVLLFSMSGDAGGLTFPAGQTDLVVRYNEAAGGYVLCAAEGRYQAGMSGEISAASDLKGAWISQMITLRYAQRKIVFDAGEHGTLTRERLDRVSVSARGSLTTSDIPSVNADNGYAFTGWRVSSGTARLDAAGVCKLDLSDGMTLTAQYRQQTYTVKFALGIYGKSKDTLVFSDLKYGATIKVPNVIPMIGWSFAGWDKTPATKVVGNATYTAKYTQNVYTVTFDLGQYGTSEDTLVYTGLHLGDTITVPNVTANDGWVFDGWDIEPVTTVLGTATYTAQYSEAETGYTVTFDLGEYGTSEDTLVFTNLKDGDEITVPNVTAIGGWEFTGWDVSPETTVYGSATYTAQYSERLYTIIFNLGPHAHSDDQLEFYDLHYGDPISVPSFWVDPGWLLIGWLSPLQDYVTDDMMFVLSVVPNPTK